MPGVDGEAGGDREIRIIATRTTDDFVELDERARIASEATADLLISIHADALDVKKIGEKNVQDVRGGTIYTLSETASDEQAKLLAQNENKADLKAGIGSEEGLPCRGQGGNQQHPGRA